MILIHYIYIYSDEMANNKEKIKNLIFYPIKLWSAKIIVWFLLALKFYIEK